MSKFLSKLHKKINIKTYLLSVSRMHKFHAKIGHNQQLRVKKKKMTSTVIFTTMPHLLETGTRSPLTLSLVLQIMRQEATLQVQRVLVSTSCRSLVHLDAHVISHTPTQTVPSTPALGGWGVEVTGSREERGQVTPRSTCRKSDEYNNRREREGGETE